MGRASREALMRAAIYVRVSTDDQDCALQLEDLHRYVELRKWELAGTFRDEGVSGAKRSRPALDDLIRQVKKGKFDVVLVWRFDRMARSTTHLIEVLDTLRSHQCQFVSTTEQIDTSGAAGMLMFTIIAAFAEYERQIIRERSAAGMAVARANGVRFGRPEKHEIPLLVIEQAIQQHGGQRAAARALGIPASTLRHRMKQIAPAIQEEEVICSS